MPKNNNFILAVQLINLIFFATPNLVNANDNNSHQKIERIISLAPHVTEMIYSAGAGDKLVGVVKYSDYPKEALKLPIIGSYNSINIEAILSLKPDVVIGWKEGNQIDDLKKVKSAGIKVWQTEVNKLQDIPQQIRLFGSKLGTYKTADKLAKKLEQELTKVKSTYQKRSEVSVYYQIWNKPFITINDQQFIGQAIQLCGATNIFHDLPLLSAEVNLETILYRNPEVILLGGMKEAQQGWYQQWQKWSMLTAVENQHIYKLNADLYQRPTARFIYALEDFCKTIDKARK